MTLLGSMLLFLTILSIVECICVESGCVFFSKSSSNGFHNVSFVGDVLLLCEEDVFDGEDFFDGEEDFFDGE